MFPCSPPGSSRRTDARNGVNDRTVAVVDIVEAKAREQKMVTVRAAEMATAISGTGKIALYGIYFDSNKADVKPESDPTLEQIAKLPKDNAALKLLVVGLTDNVGGFPYNMDLSQRRAAAVVSALVKRGIGKERLAPYDVSFASQVASNKTDEGRAKNRRVDPRSLSLRLAMKGPAARHDAPAPAAGAWGKVRRRERTMGLLIDVAKRYRSQAPAEARANLRV